MSKIQIKRYANTSHKDASTQTILAVGEPFFDAATNELRIGDGAKNISLLPALTGNITAGSIGSLSIEQTYLANAEENLKIDASSSRIDVSALAVTNATIANLKLTSASASKLAYFNSSNNLIATDTINITNATITTLNASTFNATKINITNAFIATATIATASITKLNGAGSYMTFVTNDSGNLIPTPTLYPDSIPMNLDDKGPLYLKTAIINHLEIDSRNDSGKSVWHNTRSFYIKSVPLQLLPTESLPDTLQDLLTELTNVGMLLSRYMFFTSSQLLNMGITPYPSDADFGDKKLKLMHLSLLNYPDLYIREGTLLLIETDSAMFLYVCSILPERLPSSAVIVSTWRLVSTQNKT